MGDCSGNCGGCKDKDKPKVRIIRFNRSVVEDMHSLLNPPKKNQKRVEELVGDCEHYEFGRVNKNQCMNCIREWVNTVPIEESEKFISIFENKGKKITAERIKEAIKERKWNEWNIG